MNPRFIRLLEKLRRIPFWINDREEHKRAIAERNGECCFNHIMRLPRKNNTPLPIFDYEQDLISCLDTEKRIWVKKARGLGVTEIVLRYLVWLCTRNDYYRQSLIVIVTGPRQDVADEHILRIQRMFEYYGIYFDTSRGTVEINDVVISSFPSNHVDSIRGYDRVPFLFLDEADFFRKGEQINARNAVEGYIPKTNPTILMVSTPNRPDGLFASMEKEEDLGYTKLFFPYTVGLNKIYDPVLIEQERRRPYFEREYNLKYLGGIGNIFNIRDIEAALEQEYDLSESITTSIYYGRSMGIDPGFGSSEFGIVITQVKDGKVEVIYADSLNKPTLAEGLDRVHHLIRKHHIPKVYVDASASGWCRQLKQDYKEYVHYDLLPPEVVDSWITSPANSPKIVPIDFQSHGTPMLDHLVNIMESRQIRIDRMFDKLMIALRTAMYRGDRNQLDKAETSYDDVLDALRLSLLNVRFRKTEENIPNQKTPATNFHY